MANPEGVDEVNPFGAKAREPYQIFDGESQLSESIASSPYRGRPWRGWMLLCFFLRAEESKKNKTLSGIIRLEDFHALFQEVVLVIFDEGGAYTQTFLFGTAGDEADGRHAVVH